MNNSLPVQGSEKLRNDPIQEKEPELFLPDTGKINIYVHIPFCRSLCSYCAFDRTLNLSKIEPWLEKITEEASQKIQSLKKDRPDFHIDTLYFGGGTPSVLNLAQLEQLSGVFKDYTDEQTEWTMELNPEGVDLNYLSRLRNLGINRLSIGIQSFHDPLLKRMNRHHTAAEAAKAVRLAKKAGFDRISADLIYALPEESMEDLKEDLQSFLNLNIDHLSIYSLQIEPRSVFGAENLQPIDEDMEADQYELIRSTLTKAGYEHYEISSFARYHQYSRHNSSVWLGEDYAGIGYGACGRDQKGYYFHDQSLQNYLEQGAVCEYSESDFFFTDLMMSLRTRFGADLDSWNRKYSAALFSGRSFEEIFREILEKYPEELNMVSCPSGKRLVCTEKGMEILNSILVDFMEILERESNF